MKKIGVSLSGGGIRSFSQLPIMKALEEEGIKVSYLSGTSMGSVIAGLLACGLDVDTVKERILIVEKKLTDRKVFRRISKKLLPFTKEKLYGGFVDGQVLEELLIDILKEIGVDHISQVTIPLAIPAVDIITGKTVVFVSHPDIFTPRDPNWIVESDVSLSTAILASCSFPFVISSVSYKNYRLVDGGLSMNLPIPLVQSYGADKTIGVTMHPHTDFDPESSLIALGNRVFDIMRVHMDQPIIESADLILNVPVNDIQIFEIGKGKESMLMGERVIKDSKKTLTEIIYKKPWYKRIFK